MVSLTLNQFMAPNESVVQLNFATGSIKLVFHEQRYGTMRHGDEDWQWSEPGDVHHDEFFREQARCFLDAVAGEAPVLCTLDEALHTLKVNLAALESAGNQRIEIQ